MSTATLPAALPAYPMTAPVPLPGVRPAANGQPGLTADELDLFHERGWVVKRGLVDAATIAAIGAETDGLHERMRGVPDGEGFNISWEDGVEPPRIRQLMGSERVSPLLDAVSRSEAVLAVMHQLIGPEVRLYHSKLMMKAANDGTFTPWHQDFQYWVRESRRPTQVNCMLSIDASDEGNGALRMIDGSHRRGLLEAVRLRSSSFDTGLAGGLDDFASTLIATRPGDAVFFGAYVIHGSGPNTSPRHRRANTFAYDGPGNWIPGTYGRDELPADSRR